MDSFKKKEKKSLTCSMEISLVKADLDLRCCSAAPCILLLEPHVLGKVFTHCVSPFLVLQARAGTPQTQTLHLKAKIHLSSWQPYRRWELSIFLHGGLVFPRDDRVDKSCILQPAEHGKYAQLMLSSDLLQLYIITAFKSLVPTKLSLLLAREKCSFRLGSLLLPTDPGCSCISEHNIPKAVVFLWFE